MQGEICTDARTKLMATEGYRQTTDALRRMHIEAVTENEEKAEQKYELLRTEGNTPANEHTCNTHGQPRRHLEGKEKSI